jgi:hypothetical protein
MSDLAPTLAKSDIEVDERELTATVTLSFSTAFAFRL